jgi:SpoVK/Ycf46/Vps4 family AAA+-type ATPase
LRGVPHRLTGDQLAEFASHTAGLSGADIEELVSEAKRQATRRDARRVSIENFLPLRGSTPKRETSNPIHHRKGPDDSNGIDPLPEEPFEDEPSVGIR